MTELQDKINTAIQRIQTFEPPEGYYLAFSGGKDSVVVKALADMASVKYDAHYRVTSVDPPELIMFIKRQHPDVEFEIPRYPETEKNPALRGKQVTMWNLIPKRSYPPTRLARFCCEWLKESGGDGRMMITGVRWAESSNRRVNQGLVTLYGKKISKELSDEDYENFSQTKRGGVILTNDNDDSRRVIENCYKRTKTTVNPIIDWSDDDVWEFIRTNNIPYCSLYDEGFSRLGCIGCPMARTKGREREFERWPTYKKMYIFAFDKMLKERVRKGLPPTKANWDTAQDVFDWWMEYKK